MKVLFAVFWIELTLLTISEVVSSPPIYEMDDNSAHGVRISGNDQCVVTAFNAHQSLALLRSPYQTSTPCRFDYPVSNLYVYSVAVMPTKKNTTSSELCRFALVGEEMTTQETIFIWHTLTSTEPECRGEEYDLIISSGIHQEYMFLKIHPLQNIAYIFTDTFIMSFDMDSRRIIKKKNFTDIYQSTFRTHAVDITATYAILVGFYVDPRNIRLSYYMSCLIYLNPLRIITSQELNNGWRQTTAQILSYNSANDMSVVMNPRRGIAIIGLPALNKVVLVSINTTSAQTEDWTLNITRTDVASQSYTGFGRSVAWIDDVTVAIAVLTVPNRAWAQSEVWIFDVDKPFKTPLFVFPNNQQQIVLPSPPLFLQIVSWSRSLFIVTDQTQTLLIPSQPPGFSSLWDVYNSHFIYVLKSAPCLAGTYKNTSGFGPCDVCPPQTKNIGNQPCSKCEPCAPNSFCPLAAVNDVSLAIYPPYTQTFSYPNTPDMNNYDDLLVQNIFAIGHSRRCIAISPLFWMIIAITLCSIVWFIMTLSKICNCPKGNSHRNRAKKFFKSTDIVNEGERWIGGLFSFAIILLFGFTVWFASQFVKLYPIETSDASYISCDDTIRNAVFQSALQFPLPNPDGNQWSIFEMLDAQPFTMAVDLLNTAADCSSITVQQNRPGVNYLLLPNTTCLFGPDNATRSISFLLPTQYIGIQINITRPFFVGGMRVCLHGPGRVDGVHTLQVLDMCQLFSTVNETLSRSTILQIVLTKVINVTKPLKVGGDTYYNGRWAPSFIKNSLSDKLIYEQDGHYLRYIYERTILGITLSEQTFYLENIQQPIVRRAELAFHTLLFCTLIIELYAIGFLVFRLIVMPLFRIVLRYCHREKQNDNKQETLPPQIT